jgi:hypothetical protein
MVSRRAHLAAPVLAALGVAAACALGACSKEDKAGAAGGVGGPPEALLDAWKKASLTVSAFTADKSGAIGATCHSGTVSGVDVVWCSFADRKSTRLNSSHNPASRMPSSA